MAMEEFAVTKTDEEWRRQLTPEQYAVLRGHGTEFPGSRAADGAPRRHVCVRGVRSTAVRRGQEIRERNGLAQFLCADRRIHRHHRRSEPWHDPHRSALQPVRWTSGSRVPRRSTADRTALLHQRRGPELQSQEQLALWRSRTEFRWCGRADAGSRSEARSCHPPACSGHCSTSRTAPLVRRCNCRPGEHISSVQPCRPSVGRIYASSRLGTRRAAATG
jgi:hypothetical protein